MRYTICAYFDKDLEKFNPPLLVPFNLDDTIGSIIDGVRKGKIEDAKAFDLYHLGFYETDDAKFEILPEPKKVLVLADYIRE